MLWNHSEEALGLEARSPKYCRYIKTWMRFEERLAMFKAKAKEAVAKQSTTFTGSVKDTRRLT